MSALPASAPISYTMGISSGRSARASRRNDRLRPAMNATSKGRLPRRSDGCTCRRFPTGTYPCRLTTEPIQAALSSSGASTSTRRVAGARSDSARATSGLSTGASARLPPGREHQRGAGLGAHGKPFRFRSASSRSRVSSVRLRMSTASEPSRSSPRSVAAFTRVHSS